MSEDLEAIGRKLSEPQRRAVRLDRFPPSVAQYREHRVYAALERRGILQFQHRIAGRGDFTLTELGERLREQLRASL